MINIKFREVIHGMTILRTEITCFRDRLTCNGLEGRRFARGIFHL
jgi:hypothetical protein